MICKAEDDRLLFLLHGQLGFPDKVRVVGHLMTCNHCRARYQDFRNASSRLMQASTSVYGFGRRNRIEDVFQPMLVLRNVLPALFIATTIGVLLLGWSRFQAQASTERVVKPSMLRCRPDLANDHCR